jgi:VanZ family protein
MKSNNLHVGRRRTLRAWAPPALTAAGIFVASSMTGSTGPGFLPPGTDKLLHFATYALLAALVTRALATTSRDQAPAKRLVFWSALLATGYGLTDEVHQLFVPGRMFELADLGADATGALLGAAWMARVLARRATASLPSPRPP